jgi:hypothetical protein
MSEIKIFICCVLIIVRFRKKSLQEAMLVENYAWVFFMHDALIWLACIQFVSDWRTKHQKETLPVVAVLSPPKPEKKRVINESDFNILQRR